MTAKNLSVRWTLPALSLLLLAVLSACAGSGTPPPVQGLGFGQDVALQPGNAPAGRPAASPDPAVAEGVGRELAMLRGVRGDDQLRTLRWMLSVPDDRRLAGVFEDLSRGEESLDRRAAEARVRLEALASRLEAAGHRAPEPDGAPVAQVDPGAPEPEWIPPSLMEELAAHPDDPEAVRALEEARRITPRGTRPPG